MLIQNISVILLLIKGYQTKLYFIKLFKNLKHLSALLSILTCFIWRREANLYVTVIHIKFAWAAVALIFIKMQTGRHNLNNVLWGGFEYSQLYFPVRICYQLEDTVLAPKSPYHSLWYYSYFLLNTFSVSVMLEALPEPQNEAEKGNRLLLNYRCKYYLFFSKLSSILLLSSRVNIFTKSSEGCKLSYITRREEGSCFPRNCNFNMIKHFQSPIPHIYFTVSVLFLFMARSK